MDPIIEANERPWIELHMSNLYIDMQRKREIPLRDLVTEATESTRIELVRIPLILVNKWWYKDSSLRSQQQRRKRNFKTLSKVSRICKLGVLLYKGKDKDKLKKPQSHPMDNSWSGRDFYLPKQKQAMIRCIESFLTLCLYWSACGIVPRPWITSRKMTYFFGFPTITLQLW